MIAHIDEAGNENLYEGRCEGVFIDTPRGDGGFGYDPAFVPDDTGPGRPADDGRARAWTKSTRSATAAARRASSREALGVGEADA